jgi:hypothetical protein
VGHSVTPNRLVSHDGWDSTRKIRTKYVGALDILNYSFKVQGGVTSYEYEEPAQVLKCPCCSSYLAIPSVGITGSEHVIHWIVKSSGSKPSLKAADLDYSSLRVRNLKMHDNYLPNQGYYVLSVEFTTTENRITDDKIREWWRECIEKKIHSKFACASASRPGYFIRRSPHVHHNACDFEIHCPNPDCDLNSVEWFEKVPAMNNTDTFLQPLEPFVTSSKRDYWHGVPISAFTADAQIYARCPSVIIATVDKHELEMDGLIAHPDIMSENEIGEENERLVEAGVKAKGQSVIVELKDTVNGRRLDFYDSTFRSYLRQLLYYMVMAGMERGIISIRYNIKELRWVKSDPEGDYFF